MIKYQSVELSVVEILNTCYSGLEMGCCTLLTEEGMDGVFPPKIREINVKRAKQDFERKTDVESYVRELLDSWIPDFHIQPSKRDYDDLVAHLVKWVMDYLAGQSEGSWKEMHQYVEQNEWACWVDNLIGALTFNSKWANNARQDLSGEIKRYQVFTAMGCYCRGEVYLCPERIAMAAGLLGVKPDELAEVVWLHEEMHARLNSDLSQEMNEHLAQTMTAGALARCGKNEMLDVMTKLATEQPTEYALFAMKPNCDLLPIRGIRGKGSLGGAKRTAPKIVRLDGTDHDLATKIEKWIGTSLVKLRDGVYLTGRGKYLLTTTIEPGPDGREGRFIINWPLLSSFPEGRTFLIVQVPGDRGDVYVFPMLFLIETSKIPDVLTISTKEETCTMSHYGNGALVGQYFNRYDLLNRDC